MGEISGCRLCATGCAAVECFADSRPFLLLMRFATASRGPEAADLACVQSALKHARTARQPAIAHARFVHVRVPRIYDDGASHLRGACKRALPASVAAPLLSKRLRRAPRTTATGRRSRNLRAHAQRADAQCRAFAQASRASLLRSCALVLLCSCALVPSHLRPRRASLAGAPRSANQLSPRSSGHRYESNRDRTYAYSRTAPR